MAYNVVLDISFYYALLDNKDNKELKINLQYA